ncbi:MAG: winged helix-turn-helix domain-containing protein [Armatimonadota bacterium]
MEIKDGRSRENHTESGTGWTFLTNYSHVLICLTRDPSARLRDVALEVGITERAVQRIVSDLENDGVLTHIREGRRNRYTVNRTRPLRHPVEHQTTIGALLDVVMASGDAPREATAAADKPVEAAEQ